MAIIKRKEEGKEREMGEGEERRGNPQSPNRG